MKINLKLKLTQDIENIDSLLINTKKYIYDYKNKDILFQILVDEYSLLNFNTIIKYKTDYIENYNSNKKFTNYGNLLQIKNNNIIINKYILFQLQNIMIIIFYHIYIFIIIQ